MEVSVRLWHFLEPTKPPTDETPFRGPYDFLKGFWKSANFVGNNIGYSPYSRSRSFEKHYLTNMFVKFALKISWTSYIMTKLAVFRLLNKFTGTFRLKIKPKVVFLFGHCSYIFRSDCFCIFWIPPWFDGDTSQ